MKYLSLLFVLAVLFMQTAYAAPDIQIDTVKKMYQLGKKSEQGMLVIEKYADTGLKKAFKIQEEFGDICGYESDMMWQSQDPEFNRALSFTKL